MAKNGFEDKMCSIARTLDIIGEWWSLLIVRDLFLTKGTARFEELREGLGISRNILTERLRKLKAPLETPAARRGCRVKPPDHAHHRAVGEKVSFVRV